jgi:RHS repeat-associated protein
MHCVNCKALTPFTRRFFSEGEQIGGTNYFFTRDHLGSIREMTDTNRTIRADYSYDPWGRRTKVSGDLDADFGFTGHYYHAPSGLHLALYRAYSAELGRWLNRDPIQERGGLNLYGYVRNAPIDLIDSDGLICCEDCEKFKGDIERAFAAATAAGYAEGWFEDLFWTTAGLAVAATGPVGEVVGVVVGGAGDIHGIHSAAHDISEAKEKLESAKKLYADCISKCR